MFTIALACVLAGLFSGKAIALPKAKYNYLIYIPDGYNPESTQKWPVIFYLHGRHASGKKLQNINRYGLPYFLDKGKKLDFIVVSPQCPWGKNWASDDWFNPLLEEISEKYNIDENRIYMIGISMGGFGTWELAYRMPEQFAAIVPMCGGAKTSMAEKLSKTPAWVFHGTADNVIPISRSESMVKAIEKLGAEVKFTRLKNQGHDISREFNNDQIYEWLKTHSLKKTPFWEEPLPFLKGITTRRLNVSMLNAKILVK